MRKKEDLGDFITIGAALILYAKGTAIEVEDGRFLIVQRKVIPLAWNHESFIALKNNLIKVYHKIISGGSIKNAR